MKKINPEFTYYGRKCTVLYRIVKARMGSGALRFQGMGTCQICKRRGQGGPPLRGRHRVRLYPGTWLSSHTPCISCQPHSGYCAGLGPRFCLNLSSASLASKSFCTYLPVWIWGSAANVSSYCTQRVSVNI